MLSERPGIFCFQTIYLLWGRPRLSWFFIIHEWCNVSGEGSRGKAPANHKRHIRIHTLFFFCDETSHSENGKIVIVKMQTFWSTQRWFLLWTFELNVFRTCIFASFFVYGWQQNGKLCINIVHIYFPSRIRCYLIFRLNINRFLRNEVR